MNWNNALQDFEHYLKIERGLSIHTINSYHMDVQKLISFLETHKKTISPITIDFETVQVFLYELAKTVNARTQSRVISGLRSFFDYLILKTTERIIL